MKKVLILAYDFPPYVSVGGLRPYSWYRYFNEFGCYPVVITRQWSNKHGNYLDYVSPSDSKEILIENTDTGKIIRTPYRPNFANRLMLTYGESRYRFLRKTISVYYETVQWIRPIGPKVKLYFAARDYLKNNKVDVIIATGDPFILFKYASKLSKKFDIPWIADYRDPWSQNFENQKYALLKIVNSYFEKRIVKSAKFITTVSEFLKLNISAIIKDKKYFILPNGYDHEVLERLRKIKQNDEILSIALVGTIYPWHPIKSFLAVVSKLISENRDLKLHLNFYGINMQEELHDLISKEFQNIRDYISVFPKINNDLLLEKLATNHVMLLFNSYFFMGTKIYEYIGLKRKIILCYSDDDEAVKLKRKYFKIDKSIQSSERLQENLINETKSGIVVRDASHLGEVLKDLYHEFEMNGFIECDTINELEFSRKIQVQKFTDIIHKNGINSKASSDTNNKIIRLLILAYDFPPYVSVGGLRPYSWFQHLQSFGIHPIVVTRQWGNIYKNHLDYIAPGETMDTLVQELPSGTMIRTPYSPNFANRLMLKYGERKYRWLRKIISVYYEIMQWFFIIGPKSGLYKGAQNYLKTNEVDAIIATGDPFFLFKYASMLSKEFDIQWIADYRDPWSQYKVSNKNYLNFILRQYFEKKYAKSAALITTVSGFFKTQISVLVKDKTIAIVPNGYNQEIISNIALDDQKSELLRIGFAGTISNWHPIESFINVLSEFITENPEAKIEVNFYGINIERELQSLIDSSYANVKPHVKIFPRISNDKLLLELAQNNIMLLFNYYSIIGTKVYDYLALKRAILLCYANDIEALKLKEKDYIVDDIEGLSMHAQEDLIRETNGGYIAQDASHLKVLLSQLHNEFLQTGTIACHTKNIEQYSRLAQAGNLASIIKDLINKRGNFPDRTRKENYQMCTRCVMDTSDVDIRFNEQGVCNHCTNYFERIASRVYQGEGSDKELVKLINKIKKAGKNKPYDCIIGVSGGIDSSYVAYKAKKRGLRALLVHLDNGWNSEISVKNIVNLASILGFDYESFVLDWEEFKDIQLAFLRASIPEMETPTDIAISGALHQVAAKYGVKYIISGGNFATEGILPKTWHYNAKDNKYFRFIQKTYGLKKMHKFPFFGWEKETYYKLFKGIKIVYILNYVDYKKDEAMEILQNELGWRYYGGKHYENKYTGFVQSYIMPEKFNIDYRRATLSTQICTGEVVRETAIETLQHKPYDSVKSQEEKEYVCKKLGITLSEFEDIMKLPPKIYRDYPNAEKKLEVIYKIYRKVYGKPSYKEE